MNYFNVEKTDSPEVQAVKEYDEFLRTRPALIRGVIKFTDGFLGNFALLVSVMFVFVGGVISMLVLDTFAVALGWIGSFMVLMLICWWGSNYTIKRADLERTMNKATTDAEYDRLMKWLKTNYGLTPIPGYFSYGAQFNEDYNALNSKDQNISWLIFVQKLLKEQNITGTLASPFTTETGARLIACMSKHDEGWLLHKGQVETPDEDVIIPQRAAE